MFNDCGVNFLGVMPNILRIFYTTNSIIEYFDVNRPMNKLRLPQDSILTTAAIGDVYKFFAIS